jgi:hypothetical protein
MVDVNGCRQRHDGNYLGALVLMQGLPLLRRGSLRDGKRLSEETCLDLTGEGLPPRWLPG